MLEELAQYIATELELTLGADLYAGHRPEGQADLCTSILEQGQQNDLYILRFREFSFQLLTQGATAREARNEADRIWEWLIYQQGFTLPSWETCHVIGRNGPQNIGQDESGRFLLSANITVQTYKKE